MAFTPVTIPAGNVLATNASGQGVQNNLDKMKNYIDGGVVSGDLATDSWAQAKHIMRGHYDPIVNMHSFTSGLNGGQVADDGEFSFLGDGPTGRNNPSDSPIVSYPATTIDFFLPANADVLFQFSAFPHTPNIANLNSNFHSRLFIFLDETQVLASKALTTHVASSVSASEKNVAHYQNPWSGFYMASNLAAGEHSIGLRGFTRARYSFLTKWSVSFEAFYR
tara:strand:+ start:3846 stop:4511 length:666 start_codon:yes stop_codon:yes gene_type:complete